MVFGECAQSWTCIPVVTPPGRHNPQPISDKVRDDQRLLGLLKQAWLKSDCVYGYRKLTLDMRDLGERCGKHRVARVVRREGIHSQTGYRRRAGGRVASLRWWPPTI